MKEVYDFLKKCGTYFLATTEGSQPRVRPFGTIDLFEDKLYIQTGKSKEVSKQIAANPQIEICAFDGKDWLRVEASAVEDDRVEARAHMLDSYPELKAMASHYVMSLTDGACMQRTERLTYKKVIRPIYPLDEI